MYRIHPILTLPIDWKATLQEHLDNVQVTLLYGEVHDIDALLVGHHHVCSVVSEMRH